MNIMKTNNEENAGNRNPHQGDVDDEIVSSFSCKLILYIHLIPVQSTQDMLKSDEVEAILSQLNKDGELEAVLSQERMRAERHRNNYAKMKEEYVKLVHENRILTSEISRIDSACDVARSTAIAMKQQSDANNTRINEELKMLEIQVPTAAELLDMENKETG